MTFHWALDQLKGGRAVKRQSWFLSWSKLQQHIWISQFGATNTPTLHFLFSGRLSAEDLFANDWIEHIKENPNAQSK